ncbi:unnamed protein product [Brachionus calyciflorus]|uniref:RING-type domain-containing protein n=1 Tax=Brachionus calyciflorus TaxID=104777 RepID=A0A814H9X2_9BILA|nr:unnamed protein product [Brachionus calyciflorus]
MIFDMDSLICQFCKKYFTEPKVLPCGENACSKCLPELGKFDCLLCAEVHSMPENGFPTNKILSKALEKNFKSDEYEAKTQEFRKYIEDTEKKFDELKLKRIQLEVEVIEHCKLLINEIDLNAEEKINQINDIRDDLIKEVNEYQDRFLKNLKMSNNHFSTLSEKVNLLTKDKDLLLAKKDFDEKLDNYYCTLSEVELSLNKIRHRSLDYRKIQFNSNRSNLDENFLGFISFKNLKNINSNVLKQLKEDLPDLSKETGSTKLNRLENGNFIFSFMQAFNQRIENGSFKSREFSEVIPNHSRKSRVIRTPSSNSLEEECFKVIFKFTIINLSSYRFIEIANEKELLDLDVATSGNFVFLTSFKSKYIKKYDTNFSLLKTVDLLESPSLILPTKKFVLIYFNSALSGTYMNVYDLDLNFLITVKNNSYNSFLDIPNNIKKMFINDKYYLFQEENNSISVVNQEDGRFFKKITSDQKNCNLKNIVKITNDFIIIAYNLNKFEFRNLNGELFYEIKYESNDLTFFVEDQNRIFSFNNTNYELYENKFL